MRDPPGVVAHRLLERFVGREELVQRITQQHHHVDAEVVLVLERVEINRALTVLVSAVRRLLGVVDGDQVLIGTHIQSIVVGLAHVDLLVQVHRIAFQRTNLPHSVLRRGRAGTTEVLE